MKGIVALLLIFALSCASGKNRLREHKGSYLESVRLNYEAGMEAFRKEEFDKAIKYFQFVRSKYPFSQYAAQSDMKIADVKFAQKKWLDAASAYEVFIRLHPRHEDVPYASYRVGLSYFHAVPGDFFILPKATSRDQSFTKESLTALERFIIQFPTSEFITDAKEKRNVLFSNLAQHNQHIAAYYEKRGRYEPAVERYLAVENLYPETKEAAESLFKAAEILRRHLHDDDTALELYNRIVDDKPESKFTKKAQVEIEKIRKKQSLSNSDEE